ncbi:MAG: diaminopropionate ammonia-lyase [Deltaproteobacteria bacterium SG8_13]|nr:MAG: diaminopropionate ammonia-lyase [Deltaproteobacteria bacterium SG8_13]
MKPDSDDIVWQANSAARAARANKALTDAFSSKHVTAIREFHRAIPGYQPTPLAALSKLAEFLGVGAVWVKDESYRFGLNAFKVLGASFALIRTLEKKLQCERIPLGDKNRQSASLRNQLENITCVTATDGNHGRAVAWGAEQIGCRSVVFMPAGSSPVRLENIRRHGAEASIIDGNYDDAVRMAADLAEQNDWLLIQDTARPGYTQIPEQIMQGYLTLFDEAFEQVGEHEPTHVFIQCGVGSLPASLLAFLVERYGGRRPTLISVEPTRAASFYRSVVAADGNAHAVTGRLDTIMAGLACGEPSSLAWEILRDHGDIFVACPDRVSVRGMRVLGNPLPDDRPMVSGESGAVTLGLVYEIATDPANRHLREHLRLDRSSRILLFSTEGDTDPQMYRKIVWGDWRPRAP